jgi:hypothetical protein
MRVAVGELHTSAPSLRQTDGDCLLGGAGAVFAFSNMLHLFTDALSRLCGRRLSFARVAPRTLECLSFTHIETSESKVA